ncbi:hypothetical protein ACIQ9Q_24770 [Streptomyces sp. NPDC094438]|uniref:hypothetical protein n=1 Tax=Streptomyces sp. NPDC094438 TaxID=3366061 RepID=UPI0038124C67
MRDGLIPSARDAPFTRWSSQEEPAVDRLLLASLMVLAALTAPAATDQPAATGHCVATEPTLRVRTSRWQTRSTYYVDGIAWTPHAVDRTDVEGWEKEPHARQWSQDW